MKISLTGNPFVDTGLAVLASLSSCKSIDDLTLDQMKKVHGNGEELARWNSKLKSTSMIFTIDSLATHPGIKPLERKMKFYSQITTAILNSIDHEDVHERCESCGNEFSLNLDELIRRTLVPLGYKDKMWFVGRDWFPLAGSMGSDAQALPAASRSPNLCAKCLFAVHYLPEGIMLMDGRLAVFQSTSRTLWYSYVRSIVEEVRNRIQASNFETLGRKEGNATVVRKTLDVMKDLRKLDSGVSLFIWKFSNSGQNPDCSIEEIPNQALQFLFEVNINIGREDIIRLVSRDRKPEYSLLNCITKGTDYQPLYPLMKYEGASPEFFSLYQTRVRKVPELVLNIACKIAKYIEDTISDKKRFETFRKDLYRDLSKRNQIRKYIADMVREEILTFKEYSALFSIDIDFKIRTNNNAWKYIYYYMYHIENSDKEEKTVGTFEEDNRLLLYIASTIYDTEMKDRGHNRFEKDILDRFTNNKITSSWLRRQFLKNAESNEGFTYENWKVLCLNDQGKESVYELLFRLRLIWTEWWKKGKTVSFDRCPLPELIPMDTDLPSEYEEMVYKIMDDYIHRRGLSRSQKDTLWELRSGEKDLHWFRTLFSQFDKRYSDDIYWAQFITDSRCNSIKPLRLFQLSLLLANRFREQAFKKRQQIANHVGNSKPDARSRDLPN